MLIIAYPHDTCLNRRYTHIARSTLTPKGGT